METVARRQLNVDRLAEIAKALAHPARVQIVMLLAEQSECRGADVFGELPLAQSTISEHLRILREAGIVSATSAGIASVYCLDANVLETLADQLDAVVSRSRCCAGGGCE